MVKCDWSWLVTAIRALFVTVDFKAVETIKNMWFIYWDRYSLIVISLFLFFAYLPFSMTGMVLSGYWKPEGKSIYLIAHSVQRHAQFRGCQIGMQGPQLCAKPRHCCKLDLAISRMAFLDLNLYFLRVATSNSNNWGRLYLWHPLLCILKKGACLQ